jgi:hypothetical protein
MSKKCSQDSGLKWEDPNKADSAWYPWIQDGWGPGMWHRMSREDPNANWTEPYQFRTACDDWIHLAFISRGDDPPSGELICDFCHRESDSI